MVLTSDAEQVRSSSGQVKRRKRTIDSPPAWLPIEVFPWPDVCRQYALGKGCRAGSGSICTRVHIDEGTAPLLVHLRQLGCLTTEGSKVICGAGVRDASDIAFLAGSVEEATAMGIGEEFCGVYKSGRADAVERARGVVRDIDELKGKPPGHADVAPSKAKAARQPRTSAAFSPTEDEARRAAAAVEAVRLARTWLPDMSREHADTMRQSICCFEAPSLLHKLRAWKKWEQTCSEKSVDPRRAGTPDQIGAFCRAQLSATGPQSMWNCLDFLRRHLAAPFVMPPKPGRQPVDGIIIEELQGVVVEPEILLRMETLALVMREKGDWRLGALLGGFFIAGATTRFAHMQRSAFIGRDDLFVHAYCYRGKQGHQRGRPAFKHACPREAWSGGASLVDMLWDLWNELCDRKKERVTYLIFDHTTGNALPQQAFHDAFREVAVIARATETPWLLTSKGLRMVQPTCCDVRLAPWEERMAVGNWREAPGAAMAGIQPRSVIPIRYAGRREQMALFVKLLQWTGIADECRNELRKLAFGQEGVLTWEQIRTSFQTRDVQVLARAVSEQLERSVARGMTAAFGARGVVDAMAARQFVIPAGRPASMALPSQPSGNDGGSSDPLGIDAEEVVEEDAEVSDDDQSDVSGESDDELVLPYVAPRALCSKVHVETHGVVGVPFCKEQRWPFSNPIRGTGLRNMLGIGRKVCKDCLKKMPEAVQEAIRRNEV